MDGIGLSFHSNDHARLGVERWLEKKKMGIKPGSPKPRIDEDVIESGGLGEVVENDGDN
jgi:hypothetical protein